MKFIQMNKIIETEQIWHNDGHKLILRINKSELQIMEVVCPSDESDEGECKDPAGQCCVRWFIDRYGMDCNGGVCPANEVLEICWTVVGGLNDLDSSQMWFMPLADDVFQAWLTTNL